MVSNPVIPTAARPSTSKARSISLRLKKQRSFATEKQANNHGHLNAWRPTLRDKMSLHEGSSVLDLKGDNYFSCAVARKRSNARYLLGSIDDVVTLIKKLAESFPAVDCLNA